MYYRHRFQLPDRPNCTIFVQTPEEAEFARTIVVAIKRRWFSPKHFYHLREGGHVRALHKHKHDNYFARLDIKNFFSSVTRNKIQRALKSIGLPLADAQTIAQRSTVILDDRRVLPFGYVQSPILASLALDKSALGKEMRQIRKSDVSLSVFMDDILLSHPDSEGAVQEACDRLGCAANESKFEFSQEKQQGPADHITAFNIEMRHLGLAISPAKFEEFSQRVLQWGASNETMGILGYVRGVNEEQLAQLRVLAKV